MNKQTIIGSAGSIAAVLFLGWWAASSIPDPMAKAREADEHNPARFERVGSVVVEYRPNINLIGVIYKDRETDIEYIYIWDGLGNGGPSMTRLWKKGE